MDQTSDQDMLKSHSLPAGARTILFVCMGNCCRSIMAEVSLKKECRRQGREVEIRSAGIRTCDGMRPPEEVLKRLGDDRSFYEARTALPVTKELLDWADVIFVMEERHAEALKIMSPSSPVKTRLLVNFDSQAEPFQKEMGIPDPFRMSDSFFEMVHETIERSCQQVALLLAAPKNGSVRIP